MYIDDIKLFAKKRKRIGNSITRSQNIQSGHRDGIWHRKMHQANNKSEKRHVTDWLELPNQDQIRTLGEKVTYKYLGILEVDTIKKAVMIERIKKKYLRRTRKLLETKLYRRNLIKRINTKAIPFVRCSGPFLKWTWEELKQMDQWARKLMTLPKALHPVDRLCVSKKEVRGLTSIKDSIASSIQRLEDYIDKRSYSHQKQYWIHEDQLIGQKAENKNGNKTTLWTPQNSRYRLCGNWDERLIT